MWRLTGAMGDDGDIPMREADAVPEVPINAGRKESSLTHSHLIPRLLLRKNVTSELSCCSIQATGT